MKKIVLLVTSLGIVFSVAAAGVIYGQPIPPIPRPQGVDPNHYVENPAPVFPDNSAVPSVNLVPREKALEAVEIPSDAKLLRLDLTTWDQTEQEGETKLIAPGRQVWILEAQFPEFEDIRYGMFKDARVTLVFDAETGQLLKKKVVGKPTRIPAVAQ